MPRKSKKNELQKVDYSQSVEFSPVHQEGIRQNGLNLKKGKYDRDYVIRLLKQLINHCELYKLESGNFGISLKHTLKALLVSIEMEDLLPDDDPIIRMQCNRCKKDTFVRKSREKKFVCECRNKLEIEMYNEKIKNRV